MPIVDLKVRSGEHWDAFDYTWEASTIENAEWEGSAVQILAVNEGSLGNFHPGLVNAGIQGSLYTPLLDRRYHAGAGAISYHPGNGFVSKQALKQGDEVFITYGEHWFRGREHYLGTIPLSADYEKANDMVASLAGLVKSNDTGTTSTCTTLTEDDVQQLMTWLKDDVVVTNVDPAVKVVLQDMETLADLEAILQSNGTAQVTSPRMTLDWLDQHGQCLDHLYTQLSSIEGAGVGAFARRPLTEGQVIIASPVLFTYGQDVLRVQRQRSNDNDDDDDNEHPQQHSSDDVNEFQVALNYHFGHANSTLLMIPINTAIAMNHYIDHQSKSNSGGSEGTGTSPNARVQWSASDAKSEYIRQRHLADQRKDSYATLVLEFVATRDIAPDEEILIDYGDEWQGEYGNSH
jgi:hypothetical protein